MTREHVIKGLVLAGIAAYLASCSFFEADWPSVAAEKDRKKAPDFALQDAAGATVKLSDYKGKVVLLNFWATWCGPCQVEIPWFIKFQNEYKDRDFAVLGVSADENGWKAVTPFVAREKINYRVVLADEQVTQLYGGIDHLPTTFIIDRQGRVGSSHEGLATMNTYRQEILTLLGSPTNEKSPLVSENRRPDNAWAGLLRASH